MTPYKDLWEVFDDLAVFGKEWVNENAERVGNSNEAANKL